MSKSQRRSQREIRADFDRDTIVVYQAFSPAIAKPAAESGKFRAPFSFRRMTWIKPSFLWLMARSGWASKSGQEHILAVRVRRSGWEGALSEAVLTDPDRGVYPGPAEWERRFKAARVHVQWDPERSLRGAKLEHRSIQVGIGRDLIQTYADEWVADIQDITPLAAKIRRLCLAGDWSKAKRFLPPEKPYPLPEGIAERLGM